MLRDRPTGTECETIATEVGRQSATATPCMARNMINSIPVRARPQARMKPPVRAQPVRLMFLWPTTSAMEPARIRQVLIVKLYGFSIGTIHCALLKQTDLRVHRGRPNY